MKRNIIVLLLFLVLLYSLRIDKVFAFYPLNGKLIIIDPGHGGIDPGTVVNDVYEKNINLNIALLLERELEKNGASVIMTRDKDYDLAGPKSSFRKKSDFDNRINLINTSGADMYISIHLNYLDDSSYYGPQVFYSKDNNNLALVIQKNMNKLLDGNREIKKIPNDIYMYNKLMPSGVLIECGFLSNSYEREKLVLLMYQEQIAKAICMGIIDYFS